MRGDDAQAAALAAAVRARTGADVHARAPALTLAELAPLVRPPAAGRAAVLAWLRHDLHASHVDETVNGDFITAVVPVARLSSALGGHAFHHYAHLATGRHIIRGARCRGGLGGGRREQLTRRPPQRRAPGRWPRCPPRSATPWT
jgi:hypothetical protein